MTYTASTYAIIALIFVLAGLVKGIVGLGLPTVAIGLLTLVVSPVEAAALLVVPSLVTNLTQMAGPGLKGLAARLWPMMAGITAGTALGMLLWGGNGGNVALLTLGAALIAYAAFGLAAPAVTCPPGRERRLSVPAGLLTGLLTSATGVFVIPSVPFLQSLGLDRDRLVQALGLSFTTSTLALAAGLLWTGDFMPSVAGPSALALIPALAGMWLGAKIRTAVSPRIFRLCFFGGLLAVGAHLVLRASLG